MPYNAIERQPYEEMGEKNEIIFKPFIEEVIGKTNKTTQRYAVIDFYSTDRKTYAELKSRDCYYKSFPTTMLGVNKIKNGFQKINNGKLVYYFFAFKDGLYYWQLTPENYEADGGENMVHLGGTIKTGNFLKDHYYIPIESLHKVCDVPCYVADEVRRNNYIQPKGGVCLLRMP